MSEYQRYQFQCIDNILTQAERIQLHKVSSRAEITNSSFSVYYHYSGLRAEPVEVLARYFDIGMHYGEWGQVDVYIKLPPSSLPKEFIGFESDCGLNILERNRHQILIFSFPEPEDYVEEERADEFYEHAAILRSELLKGDLRAVYLFFLNQFTQNETLALPLINYDFLNLTTAQSALVEFFELSQERIRALAILLKNTSSEKDNVLVPKLTEFLKQLTPAEKDTLLMHSFNSGHMTLHHALSILNKNNDSEAHRFQFWLSFDLLLPYLDLAQQQVRKEQADAKALLVQKALHARHLRYDELFSQCDTHWKSADDQAKRACASGYEQSAKILSELLEAHNYKSAQADYFGRFARFVKRHEKRKALLRRVKPILEAIQQ